jgi:hypothetical protein
MWAIIRVTYEKHKRLLLNVSEKDEISVFKIITFHKRTELDDYIKD